MKLIDRVLANHMTSLKKYALKLTGDKDTSKDLVQDTLVKIMLKEDKYTEGNLLSWCGMIMYNTFINNYRNSKKRNETEITPYTEAVVTSSNDGVTALAIGEIDRGLATLSSNHEAILRLRISGYQYDEIAEKLNIPIGSVKSRIHFATKKLQNAL